MASSTVSSIDSVRRETTVCVLFVDKIAEYRLSFNPARQSLTRGRHYCPIIGRIRESTQLPIGFVRIYIQFAELIGFIPSNVSSFIFDVRTSFATWWSVPCATSFTPTDTKQNDSIDQRGWGAFISFFFFPPRFEQSKNSARRVRFGTRFGDRQSINASLARVVAVVCDSKWFELSSDV